MKRTIYSHKLTFIPSKKKGKKMAPKSYKEDFIEVIRYILLKTENERKKDYKLDNKILYLETSEWNDSNDIVTLKFISARYASSRIILDTTTLEEKGRLKSRDDGDKENTHISIKFSESEKDIAICLYEYNYYGIGISKIFSYLSEYIKEFHKDQDDIRYKIVYDNIVCSDFLETLEKTGRIKGVTLTVDQEDVSISASKAIAGFKDTSEEIELYFRPTGRGKGISKNTVKEFYKMYNDKNKKVKRVCVNAEDVHKNVIPLDTDKMKEKFVVDVDEAVDGEASSNSVKTELIGLCNDYVI